MSVIDGTSFGLDEDGWVVADCQKIIDNYALDGVDVDIEVRNTMYLVVVDDIELPFIIDAIDEITPAIEDYFETQHHKRLLDEISAVTTYTDEF